MVFSFPSFVVAAPTTLTVSAAAPTGQTYDVSGNETYSSITVGQAANEVGTININAGNTLTTGSAGTTGTLMGHSASASGTINVSGAGASFTDNGSTYIGENGKGALNISGGATVTTGTSPSDNTYIGYQGNATGAVTVDGTGSTWTSNAIVTLGQPGTASGTIRVQNGGKVVLNANSTLNINNGTLTTTGAGSTFTANAGANLGNGSHIVVTNGATMNFYNVGLYMNVNAVLDISGAGTTVRLENPGNPTTGSWLTAIGGSSISLTDGAHLISDGGYIGGTDPTLSQMTVSGANTRWDSTVRVYVGGSSGGTSSGNGKLTISNGAKVTSATGGVALDTNSSGTMILTGQGSTFSAAANTTLSALGNFYVAYGGTGDVLVTDGALLNADHHISIASASGSTGTLSIGAAKGSAAAAPGTVTTPNVDFGDGTGTLVFNHTSSDYVFAPNITSTGVGTDVIGLYGGTTGFTGDLTGYTGTMSVDGGTLAIAKGQTLSLGGNYQQTLAGILQLGDAASKLAVTGTATFAAGTGIHVDVNALSTLTNGETVSNVIHAGTLNASTFNVVDNSALFDFSAIVNGNAVDLKTVQGTTVTAAVTSSGLPSGEGAAQVLDSVIGSGSTQTGLSSVITALGQMPTVQQVSNAVAQTLPLLVSGTTSISSSVMHTTGEVIRARQWNLSGLSGGDGFLGNKGAWVKPVGSWAHQSERNGISGYSAHSYGIVGGVDGALGSDSRTRLGFALSYMNTKVDGLDTASGNHAAIDAYQAIVYGTHALASSPDVEVNWQADIGVNQNRGHRDISFMASTAHSSYQSFTHHLGLGVARAFQLSDATTVIPTVRADYTYIRDQGYTETGAGVLNLNVGTNDTEALVARAGAHLKQALSDRASLVASAEMGYDFFNKQTSLNSSYVGGGAAFTTNGMHLSPWLAQAGGGVVFAANERTTITARYDLQSRSGFLAQTASVKARWLF
ncbi:autotransporter outer membrane beta-barrel domain-containing protein [Mangrovitalea sediminis]|uniref:autotransporter outer membrane beta-barrel domain-containing protein n=1 Tax=Mangrovitalea sediminis TaxID=1982043 RepID=UPI0013045D60|nr:autotransporter outer membrane beta-barrel domain-containing protein [Mangrovitalea sediminis]